MVSTRLACCHVWQGARPLPLKGTMHVTACACMCLQDALAQLAACYARVCCQGSLELAELELKAELRSQLKVERCAAPCIDNPPSLVAFRTGTVLR